MSARVVVFNNMITPYTNRLYNELVTRGLDIAVLSCTAQEPDRQWAASFTSNYEHRIVAGFAVPLSRSRYTHINVGITGALHALAPDILIVNGLFPSMLVAAAWGHARGLIVALTIDGWAETMPDTAYHRIVRPWLLKKCSAVICCSRKGRSYFHDLGISDGRTARVPLVPSWNAPASNPSYGEREVDLLWCGRINDNAKNAAFFEQVVVALHRRRAGLTVRVIGTGRAEARMMRRLAEAGVDVAHERYVPPPAMADKFQRCRLLMLPSLLEPWGLVCNEAMQCGVPCIVSHHVGAADELVRSGENGFVCHLIVDVWVDIAERLLDNAEEWSRLSEGARRTVADLTVGASADAYLDVVNRIARPQHATYDESHV